MVLVAYFSTSVILFYYMYIKHYNLLVQQNYLHRASKFLTDQLILINIAFKQINQTKKQNVLCDIGQHYLFQITLIYMYKNCARNFHCLGILKYIIVIFNFNVYWLFISHYILFLDFYKDVNNYKTL